MKFASPIVIGALAILGLYVFKDKIFPPKTLGASTGGSTAITGGPAANGRPATQPSQQIVTGASGKLQDIKTSVGIGKDLADIARQFGIIGGDPDPAMDPAQQAI